ncbi:MAG TPA: hypothetical protein VFW91_17690, partial [Candidatus Binatia bacterium]|nr:hypothetical protein [Candidatus Binatia bacterium]
TPRGLLLGLSRVDGGGPEHAKISMRMQHHATLKTYRSRFQVVGLSYCLDEIAASRVSRRKKRSDT